MKAAELKPDMTVKLGKVRTISAIGRPLRTKHDPEHHFRLIFTDGHQQFVHPNHDIEVIREAA